MDIKDNLAAIQERIRQAALRSGRQPCEITLAAVSKKQSERAVMQAYECGQRDFGENYPQELAAKKAVLPGDIRWHMIGRLQSNKIKIIAGIAAMFHALENETTARKLDEKLSEADAETLPTLIMVNAGEEASKGGTANDLDSIKRLAESVAKARKLKLQGLMCLPPYFDDPQNVRPYFAKMRAYRDALEREMGFSLPHLSMGMSHDFEIAIEEGSTIVRVGEAIFGKRIKA